MVTRARCTSQGAVSVTIRTVILYWATPGKSGWHTSNSAASSLRLSQVKQQLSCGHLFPEPVGLTCCLKRNLKQPKETFERPLLLKLGPVLLDHTHSW